MAEEANADAAVSRQEEAGPAGSSALRRALPQDGSETDGLFLRHSLATEDHKNALSAPDKSKGGVRTVELRLNQASQKSTQVLRTFLQ